MANKYFTPMKFVPFTLVKADEATRTELNTEAAFDLLPEPLVGTGEVGFAENFKVKVAPADAEEVVRVIDLFYNQFLYGEATSTDGLNYLLDIDPGPSELRDGMQVFFKVDKENEGQTFLNLNNLGYKEVLTYDGRSLTGGELQYGSVCQAVYVDGKFQLLSQTSTVAPEAPCDGNYYVRKDCDWYLIPDLTIPEASDIIFDDSSTVIKGDDVQVFLENMDAAVDGKANRSGDTFTGDVKIRNTAPILRLEHTSGTTLKQWYAYVANPTLAVIRTLNQYDEATPWLSFDASNKILSCHQTLQVDKIPSADNDVVRLKDLQDGFVPIQGGEFIGDVNFVQVPTTDGNPSADNDLATVAYVESRVGSGNYVPVSGGTFQGEVIFDVFPKCSGTPTQDTHLVNKAYVDNNTGGNYVPVTGGTFTGQVNFSVSPTAPWPSGSSDLATKAYVDSVIPDDPGGGDPVCCQDFNDYITINDTSGGDAYIGMNAGGFAVKVNLDSIGWAVGYATASWFGSDGDEFITSVRYRVKPHGYDGRATIVFNWGGTLFEVGNYNNMLVMGDTGGYGLGIDGIAATFTAPPSWWGTPTSTGHLTPKSYVDAGYKRLEKSIAILEDQIHYLVGLMEEAGIDVGELPQ